MHKIRFEIHEPPNSYELTHMRLMRNRVLSDGNALNHFVRFSWLCSFHTPTPPLHNFLKSELSPLHNMNTCCAPTTASGSLKTEAGWPVLSSPSSTPTPTCHLPLFTHYMSNSTSSLSTRALPSVGCYWAGISQTLPLRPVTSSAAGSQRVQVPPVRVIPHISAYLIQERGERRGATGVWSPHAWDFLTTRPCHIIIVSIGPSGWAQASLEGEQYQCRWCYIQVCLLPQL